MSEKAFEVLQWCLDTDISATAGYFCPSLSAEEPFHPLVVLLL